MFPFTHKTRDLTTDQGLPLDVSQAVPTASFSLDQPVYRSIDVLASPSMAPSFIEPPMLRTDRKMNEAFVDLPLGKSSKAPLFQVERSQRQDVPSVDSILCPLERTHFEVSGSALSVMTELRSLCDRAAVMYQAENDYEMRCSSSCDKSFQTSEFHVRLLSSGDKLIVEFQRRNGCPAVFQDVFRSAKAHWHKCSDSKRCLAAPALKRSSAMSVDASDQWNSILTWMQTDAREAIRSVAALASQGAHVPDNVMRELVRYLSSESRVEALKAITAAIPNHRLDGFEDEILVAVVESMSANLNEEREACKFVMKASQELPHILSRSPCNLIDQLVQASGSTWPCIRQYAQTSLSSMQAAPAVY